jgi:hypothetical protein
MVGTISTTTSATTVLSTATSGSQEATLKAQLASKQNELAQAKTDEDKATLNAEIAKLKAQISALQTTSKQQTDQSADAGHKRPDFRNGDAGDYSSADKSAPEGKMKGPAMDVMMRMGQQGGMMPPGGGHNGPGPQDISQMYTDMDTDSDGKVTKDEFVSNADGHMSEEDASKIYASIDTEGTGSITEDQFAASLKSHRPHGGHGPDDMGPPPFDAQSETTDGQTSSVAA